MKIIKLNQEIEPIEISNSFEELYFEKGQVRFKRFADSVYITDLTNAMRIGKTCELYRLEDREDCGALNWLFQQNFDWSVILPALQALPWADLARAFDPIPLEGVNIYRREEKAIRMFSPFALDAMKPLKETPKKWTLRHVLRALLNGQYKNLRCKGYYSDDYADDAARNFRRGEIENGQAFAKKIMQSPSGWWVSSEGDEISICCHTFDSNSFVFVLENKD